MMTINQSALATAVINITGNTQGLQQAIGETKKQMHGFLVFAQAMGGRTGGFLANMLAMGGAKPALGAILGDRLGGVISKKLAGLGVLQNPIKDIDAAMDQARADHRQRMFQHKMTGAGIQIGGTYNGVPINTPVDLASARARHSLSAPKLADSIDKFVPAAAESAQKMALHFGRLGAVVVLATPVFKALLTAGEDLHRNLRRASRIFGGSTGSAMAGFGGMGSIMTRSEFAAGATGIGTAFNQQGVGPGRSAAMSSNLAVRAGELAKSFGDDFDRVAAKIQSAVGGSNDALAEYGVILSDDLIRAKAFNDGLIKFGETMSASVAAQARYDLILSQTSKSVETGWQSFFNLGEQWTTLMSTFKSAIASVGSVLSPIVAGFLGLTNLFVKIGASPFRYIASFFGGADAASAKAAAGGGLRPGEEEEDTIGRANDDAARAAEIIDRERARQSSNVGFHSPEDFYNHVQKSIFGNPTEILKRQTDLLHQFLLVSEEQLKVMADFGYKVKNGSFLITQ
jgi:hypothetical protein